MLTILRHHKIKHSQDAGKSHVCIRCFKCFRYPKDLRRHDQTHPQVRVNWFACQEPLCARSFMRKDNLKRHQKTHAS
jgi:uncharacterized Zn-finger protein